MDGQSFGSKFAGADFDLFEFLQRPQTIVRLISLLFAIVVFGCISDGCYDPIYRHCIFDKDEDACNYGIAIGVIAFLGCLLFLALDTQMQGFSSAHTRRTVVMGDLFFSGFWCFLWFIGFCYLADAWRRTPTGPSFTQYMLNHARASVAFSFFSVITWGGLTAMALMRYRQGTNEMAYGPTDVPGGTPDTVPEGNSPYASFPTPGEDDASGYQSQPFGGQPVQPQQPVKTEYNVPSY